MSPLRTHLFPFPLTCNGRGRHRFNPNTAPTSPHRRYNPEDQHRHLSTSFFKIGQSTASCSLKTRVTITLRGRDNRSEVWLEVLKAVSIKMAVFWVVTPCRLVWVYRSHQCTRRYNSEDCHLHNGSALTHMAWRPVGTHVITNVVP
jgi:hypothetical protein